MQAGLVTGYYTPMPPAFSGRNRKGDWVDPPRRSQPTGSYSGVTPVGGPAIFSFDYIYDNANQRTNVTFADGSNWVYGYDSKGQVISVKKYFADNTAVPGQQFEFDFDDIGNRKTARAGSGSLRTGRRVTKRTHTYATDQTIELHFIWDGSINMELVRFERLADILTNMSIAANKVAEMLALPEQDRAFLAQQLIASLDENVDTDTEQQWQEIIDRRSCEIEEGKVNCRPAEQVVQDIRNKLHARRQSS